MKRYEVYLWDSGCFCIDEFVFAKKSEAIKFAVEQRTANKCYACSLTYRDDMVTKRLGDITKDGRAVQSTAYNQTKIQRL